MDSHDRGVRKGAPRIHDRTSNNTRQWHRIDGCWLSTSGLVLIHFSCCLCLCFQVGDDLYTTNTDLIQKGIAGKWANSLLLKVNQIGTVSESMDAARMIFADKGQVIVSHRSGETINTLISDLAVAIGAGFIKTGAPARSERGAKYNRLLVIEELLEKAGQLQQRA